MFSIRRASSTSLTHQNRPSSNFRLNRSDLSLSLPNHFPTNLDTLRQSRQVGYGRGGLGRFGARSLIKVSFNSYISASIILPPSTPTTHPHSKGAPTRGAACAKGYIRAARTVSILLRLWLRQRAYNAAVPFTSPCPPCATNPPEAATTTDPAPRRMPRPTAPLATQRA